MKVGQAARIALVLVVVHFVLGLVSSGYTLVRIFGHVAQNPGMVVQVALSYASWILLDVALMLVFLALSRTRGEQIPERGV